MASSTKQQVYQSGKVTPGHFSAWVTDGVIKDALIPSVTVSTAFTITRSLISTTIVPVNTFITTGYYVAGDHGANAVYTSVGATAGGLNPIQDGSGTWFNMVVVNSQFPVGWFGAKGDGVADDTSAIQEAINAASAYGGGLVVFPPGTYNISSTITVTTSFITLVGDFGGSGFHDGGAGPTVPATKLVWTAGSPGNMVSFSSPTGASAQCQGGGGMIGFQFSAATANKGIVINSWRGGWFERLFFLEVIQYGIDMNVVSPLAEANDNQNNIFRSIVGRNLTNPNGTLLRLGGDPSSGNTSFNTFYDISAQYSDAPVIDCVDADNNIFHDIRGILFAGGTATYFMIFREGSPAFAGDNVVNHFSASKPIHLEGPGPHAATNNNVFNIDSGNSAPAPVVDSGATCLYTFTNGECYASANVNLACAENGGTARDAVAAANGTNCSLYIRNGAGDHVNIADTLGNLWLLRMQGANLDFTQSAGGTNTVQFGNTTASYYRTTPSLTVGTLPTASTHTGARAMVSDSTVAASGNFGATVTGGGSLTVPVYADTANWRIG